MIQIYVPYVHCHCDQNQINSDLFVYHLSILFYSEERDVAANAQGRNTPICLGQVGLRCRFCAEAFRGGVKTRKAVYFSRTLMGTYQVCIMCLGALVVSEVPNSNGIES